MKKTILVATAILASMSLASPVKSTVGARSMALELNEEEEISARSYIQDGLIAMWDGIENAGWGVHDANAIVWKDLSGNGHDAVCASNGPGWEDDCCIILPTTQYLTPANYVNVVWSVPSMSYAALYPQISEEGYTIEVVFMQTDARQYLIVNVAGLFYGAIGTTWYGRSCQYWANTKFNTWSGRFEGDNSYLDKDSNGYLKTNSAANEKNQYTLAVDFNNAITTAYLNGQNAGSIGFAAVQGNGYGRFCFSPMISNYAGNRVYSVRLYSRALTADEIAYNYAIDRLRFNLP